MKGVEFAYLLEPANNLLILLIFALVIFGSILTFIYKIVIKSKLSKSLGREVKDHELTSINTWIEAIPEKKIDHKKYVPAAKKEEN